MKPIDELNISPWPWNVDGNECHVDAIIDADGESVVTTDNGFYNPELNDARLISEAPEMYECLREAVIEMCRLCDSCSGHPEYECENKESQCFVKKWRAALAKAAGERK